MQYLDPLYGDVEIPHPIDVLAKDATVQRLRHIRLSNIDSLQMPGIANISRFEHSLGVWYLTSIAGFMNSISGDDALIIQAAALLHDCMISPYGHLVEEAMSFLSISFNHETKLNELLNIYKTDEIGGIDSQVLFGRSAQIRKWVLGHFDRSFEEVLNDIGATIQGKGDFGQAISGDIDLDNIDNVCRAAYHMGISFNKRLPVLLAKSLKLLNSSVAIDSSAVQLLNDWLILRKEVYTHFMLSELDFIGKLMLIYTTIYALQNSIIAKDEWKSNDLDFAIKLLSRNASGDYNIPEAKNHFLRWLVGDLWDISDLTWFRYPAPDYPDLLEFNKQISFILGRDCYSYRIKDKRSRKITILTSNQDRLSLGDDPNRWLLGVGSPVKKDFTKHENNLIIKNACNFFGCEYMGPANVISQQGQLF